MKNKAKLTLFSILSAIVVIVGIVMVAVFGGFRVATDGNRLEVCYDTVITISGKEEALENTCESVISSRGLKFNGKNNAEILETQSLGDTGDRVIIYTFSKSVELNQLQAAATQISERVTSEYPDADIYVSVKASEATPINTAAWRGAIALAVAAVAASVYIGIRYGFASAVSGFIASVVAGLLSAAVFAIIPLPIYSYAPLLYAGIGSVFTLFFWMLLGAKLKVSFKEENGVLSAEEAVNKGCRKGRKYVLFFAIPIAAAMLLFGLLATNATRMFFLPALVPLLVSLFAAMWFAPSVMIPIKGKTDSLKFNPKYVGKKKADAEQQQ